MIQIAIDGYSGSGKSTLADGLAKRFNLKHLSTGAVLRAIGLYFFERDIMHPTQDDVRENLDKMDIKIVFDGGVQKTFLNGEDVTEKITDEKIGQMASRVAVIKSAMQKLIEVSRDFASVNDCVLDGRNITSEVLPNADVKFFLDANVEARANRRHKDAQQKHQDANFDDVLSSLKERDFRDSHRDSSPLVVVPDAVVVDNTNMTLDETIEYCGNIVENKLKALKKL